jgi:hypothetical protein
MSQTQLLALSEVTENFLRVLLWALVLGLIGAGACLGGAYGLYYARTETCSPLHPHRRQRNGALRRDVERGIAEIEAFLDAHSAPDQPR